MKQKKQKPFPPFSTKAKNLKLGIYQHFKGDFFKVLFVAHSAEDEKEYVVYQNVAKKYYAIRSVKMFTEKVDRDGYKGPRFKYVGKK